MTVFSLIFSLILALLGPETAASQGGHGFDIRLHPGCALLLHLHGDMAVYVQRKGRCGVSKVTLYGLDVIPGADSGHGVGMPLRYNYDKPEKPRISRVFGYLARFFILFQTEKSSREVVIS